MLEMPLLTDFNRWHMIHANKLPAALAICAAAAFIFTSCIFDAPGDRFYRTLWRSSEVPLGPFSVDKLTLEFLSARASASRQKTPHRAFPSRQSDTEHMKTTERPPC